MRANTHRACYHALVIDSRDLTGFRNLISSRYCELRFKADCNEGSTLHFDSIEELFTFENHQFRRVEAITINFIDDHGNGSLVIGSESTRCSATIVISDDDSDRAFLITDELEKRLRSRRPPYYLLSRLSGATVISAILLLFSSATAWISLTSTGSLHAPSVSLIPATLILLPAVPVLYLLARYANLVWKWLFPRVWFRLGRQDAEYEKRSRTRSVLFLSVGLALAVSVVSSIIANAITRTS